MLTCARNKIHWIPVHAKGRDSSVRITTRYGLDGPEIESRWRARLSAPVQTSPAAHPTSCTMGTGSFLEGKKRPGRDADPSPPSSVVDHERVELYLYSPYGPYGLYRASVPVQGCTLLLPLPPPCPLECATTFSFFSLFFLSISDIKQL